MTIEELVDMIPNYRNQLLESFDEVQDSYVTHQLQNQKLDELVSYYI
jgi:hypothetical protein